MFHSIKSESDQVMNVTNQLYLNLQLTGELVNAKQVASIQPYCNKARLHCKYRDILKLFKWSQ